MQDLKIIFTTEEVKKEVLKHIEKHLHALKSDKTIPFEKRVNKTKALFDLHQLFTNGEIDISIFLAYKQANNDFPDLLQETLQAISKDIPQDSFCIWQRNISPNLDLKKIDTLGKVYKFCNGLIQSDNITVTLPDFCKV